MPSGDLPIQDQVFMPDWVLEIDAVLGSSVSLVVKAPGNLMPVFTGTVCFAAVAVCRGPPCSCTLLACLASAVSICPA